MTLSSLSPTTFYLNLLDPLPTMYRTPLDSEHAVAQAKEDTLAEGKPRYIYEVRLIGVTRPQVVYVQAGNTIAPKPLPQKASERMMREIEGMQGS